MFRRNNRILPRLLTKNVGAVSFSQWGGNPSAILTRRGEISTRRGEKKRCRGVEKFHRSVWKLRLSPFPLHFIFPLMLYGFLI